MGQRSQIYYRLNNELIVANYYQWNYGERMISRARYTIEYLKEMLDHDYTWELENKMKATTTLSRIVSETRKKKDNSDQTQQKSKK